MPVYSFSQIQTFTNCPRRFRYQYVDKIPQGNFEMSPDLFLGKAVHEVLDMLYKRLNQLQKPTLDDMKAWFDQLWTERDDDEIILKEWQTKDSYYRRWMIYINEYRDKHAPFEDVRVIMTEWRITFSLDDEGTLKFRGVIDRLDKEWNMLVINDYKTNKSLPAEDKTYYQEQLTLYALWVQQQYGKYSKNIKARLHYLHFDLVDERDVTDELLDAVKEKYTKEVRSIENKRFQHNMGDDSAFPPQENPWCRRCPYQSICPLFAHSSLEEEVQLWESTVTKLVDQYKKVSEEMSALDKQKKSLKQTLEQYMKQTWYLQLFGDEAIMKASKNTNYRIENHGALLQKIKELWVDAELVKVDRFALARMIKDGDLVLEDLEWVAINESFTLRISKKK